MFRKLLIFSLAFVWLLAPLTAWADEGSEIRPVQRLGTGIPTAIAASPDGKTLAVGSSIGIWFLDASTLQTISLWNTGEWINQIDYSQDGAFLRVNGLIYQVDSGALVSLETNKITWVNHKCSFDGLMCAEIQSSLIKVKNTNTIIETALIRQWYPLDATWSPDAKKLYTIDRLNYRIKMRSTSDWQVIGQTILEGGGTTYKFIEQLWGKPSKPITVRYESNRVYVFDALHNITPRKFVPHRINVTAATVSYDQKLVVTSGGDQLYCSGSAYYANCKVTATSTQVWDSSSLVSLGSLPVLFYDVRLTPDNNVVIGHTLTEMQAWDWRKGIKLWSASESIGWHCDVEIFHVQSWCRDRTSALEVGPLSNYVISFSNSLSTTKVFLRRVSDGQLVATLAGHTSPGGEKLLGQPPYYRWGSIPEHVIYLTGVAFSPDGSQVAVSSLDGTTLIWNLP